MKNLLLTARNKVLTAIALILVFTIVIPTISSYGANGKGSDSTVETHAFLTVSPSSIGLGASVVATFWIDKVPPSGGNWTGLLLRITLPDRTTENRGPFTSGASGNTNTTYTPSTVGTYSFQFEFPGATIASENLTYAPSTSVSVLLVVQQPINSPNPTPTPMPTSGLFRIWAVDDSGQADFQTIQQAINVATAGDTVLVYAGVYREHVVINKTLTLTSLENAVIDATGDPGNVVTPTIARWSGITILSDNTIVSGFTVRSAANSGIGVRANFCLVTSNLCQTCGQGGINLYGDAEGYIDVAYNSPHDNIIQDNTVRECSAGVFAKDAHGNTIIQNRLENNRYAGIYMFSFSSNNIISDNTISQSTHEWDGSGGNGIALGTGANNNLVINNIISNNSGVGFKIDLFGLGFPYPYSNKVYGNAFSGNIIQVYDSGTNNVWDNGYSDGGNFWSDYNGTDGNHNGIGDSPYIFDIDNQDRYPLMVPFGTPIPIPFPTPTPTLAPAPTYIPAPTSIPVPTSTPNSTLTPPPTLSPSPTPTPAPTTNSTAAPVPSPTLTPTQTPTPTHTPNSTPDSTPTPSPTEPPISNAPSPPTPSPSPPPTSQNETALDLSCQSSTSFQTFKVEINGNLTFRGTGLSRLPILLSVSADGGNVWGNLTLVTTDRDGRFAAIWTPLTDGDYVLRAVWMGNSQYLGTNKTINFAATSLEGENVFSVSSNSTLSGVTFNSTTCELSFGVVGPSGTSGYVEVCIPKSLVNNSSLLKVYLDGEQLTYLVEMREDFWLISFTYRHSVHEILINFGFSFSDSIAKNPLEIWVVVGAIITPLAIVTVWLSFGKSGKGKGT
jgi:parallel beta-helix repeat protein